MAPYVLGLVLAAFLVLFSFDVFGTDEPFWNQFVGFIIHNVPSIAIVVALVVARRDERAGGLAFLLLALVSALVFDNPTGRLITALPMVVIATLFLWNARSARSLETSAVGAHHGSEGEPGRDP